jgi:hypothetical protein
VPSSINLSVTNPTVGTPSGGTESLESYRARLLQAFGRASAQGFTTFLRALLNNVSGVQNRLISIQQQSSPAGWKVIVGGGDPYQVAFAIFQALGPDVAILVGSTTTSRNIAVSINNFPDVSTVTFVNPPQQSVQIALTWNTTDPNVVSDAAVSGAAIPALVSYINSIYAGNPINLFELDATFQAALINIVPTAFLTRMVFSVSINGVPVSPTSGTGIIAGDPESYFLTDSSQITVTRG